MGTAMCIRRQKSLLQTGFCLLALACLGSGVLLYNHLQQKVKAAEGSASKSKQQQEALSAQLQVVYEHRSRLERSLQKERSEHKKTKEDFLVYKLEAQEALNKEKQDSMNRYGSLSSQHKILKNQHEEVKKQFLDLQLQHNGLKLEHRKALETHNQKYSQLQREKDNEVVGLQDTVFKLREESKLLRKAHQDVHSQLLNAQVQMEEFRKLKETLQKMPSFKDAGTAKEQRYGQPLGSNVLQFARPKASMGDGIKEPPRPQDQAGVPAGNSFAIPPPGIKRQEENMVHENRVSHNNNVAGAQGDVRFGQLAPPKEVNLALAAQPPARHKEAPMIRYTRMMNSVQNQDPEAGENLQGQQGHPEEFEPRLKLPAASEEGRVLEEKLSNKQDQRVQSWQEIVNKGNSQMNDGRVLPSLQRYHLDTISEQGRTDGSQVKTETGRLRHSLWGAEKGGTDERDLHAEAGMTKKENHTYLQKEAIIPKQMGPKDVADPAQDPNNQGEDEFEEAELERPSFEEKTDPAEQTPQTNRPAKAVSKGKIPKGADRSNKVTDNLMDDYQEDQEQDPEDRGGEVGEPEDLQQFHQAKGHLGDVDKKKEYF
ncbi:Golgi integral membrane protein 4-like isoform X2 [Notechis scutatus]|uniref:Golgi integral membrane protein 4-like isoform X1 n=1 Tax=Notechis scutatus TaxID=8663 RepID=A0A6J1V9H6_9SAUR|nr:Golgi integral membrane protein 4-like isoform X1 [Notechis scutatus]XP_026537332.1 Golgi integral membrane protein 4-like isoform X1 [Notechis scutatus]XP_026537333.1 Golgi integral membrane protein 4-like isoform X1 [Notechis scutatus]XP_026537334.1 Golgi integral membrane protein 4-like isoform X2 [Notechis scutatus]